MQILPMHTKQTLINDMFTDYNERRKQDETIHKISKHKFVKNVIGDPDLFDAAYCRWVENNYSDEYRPMIVYPDNPIMNDPKFHDLVLRYIEAHNLEYLTDAQKVQLKRDLAIQSTKMMSSEKYKNLSKEFKAIKDEQNKNN